MKKGRKLRGDDDAGAVAVAERPEGDAPIRFKPYEGSESLPDYKEDQNVLTVCRYFCNRTLSGKIKIIRVYRKKTGVMRTLAGIIQPERPNRPQDKAIFAELKRCGVPGV